LIRRPTRSRLLSPLPPPGARLEITETALLENSESAFATLHRLRGMGVRIKIKIDRSFIRDMGTDQQSVAIIQAVIGLGRA
jgi:EAL domain-containing protein (putative c-di-GMP-specific phosphodiesterase class I)